MIGTTFSHYRILEALGQGGMGVVYKAQDTVLERTVALKVMQPELLASADLRERFLREARAAAALNHPNIAHIYEAAEVDGTLFIAMEFIRGQSLRSRLGTPIPLDETLRIARDVAAGLCHAHENQLVHRDLKPENIILGDDGRARILDFGLAKVVRERTAATGATLAGATQTAVAGLTIQGQIMGTPAYMSPEQARGQEVDFRSDVFSFGAMLYEMATGEAPFGGDTPIDTLTAVLKTEPPGLTKHNARLPARLERVAARCLAKNPADRYASTQALVDDLQAIEARQASAGSAALRRARGFPLQRVVIAAALVLVAAAAVVLRPWEKAGRKGGSAETAASPDAAGAGVAPKATNWILVADFAGTGVSPDIAVATRELITASLAQSGSFTPLSRPQVVRGLRLAGKPDTTRVVGDVAAEIAERAAAQFYVEGRIDKFMSGYSIVVNVINRETRATLHTVNKTAEDDKAVISTLDELGRELRQKLGEERAAIKRAQPFRETFTASLDAYRAYIAALDLQRQAKYRPAIARLRDALQKDPEFSSAWLSVGTCYYNMGQRDSAQAAFDTAFRHSDRLTDTERLSHQWFTAYVVQYDLENALAVSDQLVRRPPYSADRYNNRSIVLFDLGRYEEAVESQRMATQKSPFGASQFAMSNEQLTLLQLGRYDEARAIIAKLDPGPLRSVNELAFALCTDDWARAESLATNLQASQGLPTQRYQGTLALAALAAHRGALELACRSLESAWATAPNPFWADLTRVACIQLHAMSGVALDPSKMGTSADTTATLYVQGLACAVAGDVAGGRARRAALDRRPAPDRRRYDTDLRILDAWLLAGQKQWAGVLPMLEPLCETGHGPWISGRIPIRWLVACALEQPGQTGSPVDAWKRVLSSQKLHQDVATWRALAIPFAHQRLAMAYARAGHMDAAREELKALEASWTTPDATAHALLAATRAALGNSPTP